MVLLSFILAMILSLSSAFVLASSDISVHSVHTKLKKEHNFLLIDVREPREWYQGRIEKAKLVPKDKIKNNIMRMVPNKNTEIVLYCASGRRSQSAMDELTSMGYSNVKSMQGGIQAWQRAGFKVQK